MKAYKSKLANLHSTSASLTTRIRRLLKDNKYLTEENDNLFELSKMYLREVDMETRRRREAEQRIRELWDLAETYDDVERTIEEKMERERKFHNARARAFND